MVDTAMKFIGQGTGGTNDPAEILQMIEHLQRKFLCSTHYLLIDLQRRFIAQIIGKTSQDPLYIWLMRAGRNEILSVFTFL